MALSSHSKFMMSWRSRGPSRLAVLQCFVPQLFGQTEPTGISRDMMMDVDTSASTCFGIANVRKAAAHEGDFREKGQKMIVLERTAFTRTVLTRGCSQPIEYTKLGLGLALYLPSSQSSRSRNVLTMGHVRDPPNARVPPPIDGRPVRIAPTPRRRSNPAQRDT